MGIQEAAIDDLLQLPVVDLEQSCVDRVAEDSWSGGTFNLRTKVLVEVRVLLHNDVSNTPENILER